MRRLPSLLLLSALAGTAGTAAWADDPPNAPTADAASTRQAPAAHTPPATDRTSGQASPASQGSSAAANRKPLDLSAPPINHVLSREQVQAMVTDYPQLEVPQGQLRALPWAIMHPLDAWRIFTPVTD
jgi:hypothetical protein